MTRTVPRTARLLTAAAALALAGGALTGCSAHPGQAYVGSYTGLDGATRSVRVSEEDVQTASSQLSAIDGVTSDTVFSALVVLQPYDELAGRYGITVTDDDARSTLETQLGPGDYSRPTINAVRSILSSRASVRWTRTHWPSSGRTPAPSRTRRPVMPRPATP